MSVKDYAGKHSSEFPKVAGETVIIGMWAPTPGPGTSLVYPDVPPVRRDVVICVPNAAIGGADAVVVVSDDGVWLKGLEQYIERRVAEALERALKATPT